MATQTQVSPEEYLRMSFDGADCDYLDGEIVERNVGERPHSRVQLRLGVYFDALGRRHPVYPYPELRMKVSRTRYRVADLAVFRGEDPTANVPSQAPFIVIEVVSRDDRYTEIVEKLEEYRKWGAVHVWLVDPWLRKLYVYSKTGLNEVPAFEIPELEARIPSSEIF
jgi:Uma2 family endonuclease